MVKQQKNTLGPISAQEYFFCLVLEKLMSLILQREKAYSLLDNND